MSAFQLRDALASAEFSGRVSDVFANIGSDKVKQKNTEAPEEHHSKEWSPSNHITKNWFSSKIVMFCLMTDLKARL